MTVPNTTPEVETDNLGQQLKMEKDWSSVVDQLIPETTALLAQGKPLVDVIEKCYTVEKQTRTSADLKSNTRVLGHIIQIVYEKKDYKYLNDVIVVLSKKRALLKGAVSKMIQQAMKYVDEIKDMKIKLELIDTLRTVTDGKIFVEVERARLTRTLTQIKESEGKIEEAADLLQELQVETFGSMDKREKTDFILEQMRLTLAKKDYTRTTIISRKISLKFFEDPENKDLRIRFYELMIQTSTYKEEWLETCKHYVKLYETRGIGKDKVDEAKAGEVLKYVVIFAVLAPYGNEQSDLIHRVALDPKLDKLPLFKEFLKCFLTNELMRWPKIQEIYGPALRQTSAFSGVDGEKRFKVLHERVVEHNIRVVAAYYTRISMKRLPILLDLSLAETESFLSKLVVNGTIYARIDRPAGIVSFLRPKDANSMLNEWSSKIHSLLEVIEKTNHLIMKEEMVYDIKKVVE